MSHPLHPPPPSVPPREQDTSPSTFPTNDDQDLKEDPQDVVRNDNLAAGCNGDDGEGFNATSLEGGEDNESSSSSFGDDKGGSVNRDAEIGLLANKSVRSDASKRLSL